MYYLYRIRIHRYKQMLLNVCKLYCFNPSYLGGLNCGMSGGREVSTRLLAATKHRRFESQQEIPNIARLSSPDMVNSEDIGARNALRK